MTDFIKILYWVLHVGLILFTCNLFSSYGENNRKAKLSFYFLLFILGTALSLGPVYRIYCALDSEIEQKKEEVKTNATLPKGMYYLGCEIISTEEYTDDEGNPVYTYTFMAVDNDSMPSHPYIYITHEMLEYDNKYLLTMDGMGTLNDYKDDEIAIVWEHIW